MAANRQVQLDEQQIQELKSAFQEIADGPTRTRLQAAHRYGGGYSVADIQEITDCSRRSLLRWCQKYREQGIDGLIDQRQGGNRALFSNMQLDDVRNKLHAYRPVDVLGPDLVATASGQHWTVPDLQQALQQWHNAVYKASSSYCELFRRCGFSYQRSAKVFRLRSAKQVAEFEEQLEKNDGHCPNRTGNADLSRR